MKIDEIKKVQKKLEGDNKRRRCLFCPIWLGVSSIIAGTLTPILLAQANDHTVKATNDSGTNTPGTSQPLKRDGWVYNGHIYETEDLAKEKVLQAKTGSRPATPGSIKYTINELENPVATNPTDLYTQIEQFEGTAPTASSIASRLTVDTINPALTVSTGEVETILTVHSNQNVIDYVTNKNHLPNNLFVHYSLMPSLIESDFTDKIEHIHLGKYSTGGYKWSQNMIEGWDKSYSDGTNHNWVNNDQVIRYAKADITGFAQPHGWHFGSTQPQAEVLSPTREFGRIGSSITKFAFRFNEVVYAPEEDFDDGKITNTPSWTSFPDKDWLITNPTKKPKTVGPTIYIYSNIPDNVWNYDSNIGMVASNPAVVPVFGPDGQQAVDNNNHLKWQRFDQAFLSILREQQGNHGTPNTVAARIHRVNLGPNNIGQIRVNDGDTAPSSFTVNTLPASEVPAEASRPWEVTDLTNAELALIQVVHNVTYVNEQAWP